MPNTHTRQIFRVNSFATDYQGQPSESPKLVDCWDKANLISSSTGTTNKNGEPMHMPCLDIDVPIRVLPSSTSEHYHLFFDTPISWNHYKAMLQAMCHARLLENGWVEQALVEQNSFLRRPGVYKAGAIAPLLKPPSPTGTSVKDFEVEYLRARVAQLESTNKALETLNEELKSSQDNSVAQTAGVKIKSSDIWV